MAKMDRFEKQVSRLSEWASYQHEGERVITAEKVAKLLRAQHRGFVRMIKEFMKGDATALKQLKNWDEDKQFTAALVISTRQAFCENLLNRLTRGKS